MKPNPHDTTGRRTSAAILLAFCLAVLALPLAAQGQCILANPSFEIGGSGGAVFGGWSQFGNVGSTTFAWHGSKAARVTGPNTGGWDVSGYWQAQDCSPGEQWAVSVHVAHPSSNPLTGQCSAIVNVEWRDSGGALIDYESHAAADASSPTDQYMDFSFVTGAAPSGTASARLLLGVLQSPTDPAPDVYYDQATFLSTSYPTIYDQQWDDFPGGTSVDFSGYTWRVKGPGYYGPGPSLFSTQSDNVWVDVDGALHMTIIYEYGSWYSTEVALVDTLGYGDYIFTTRGALDQIDPQTVLGLFIWQYGPCYDNAYLWWNPYNEIDVEISYWGNASGDDAQFVAQPYDWPGNLSRFDVSPGPDELTSFAFRWLHDRVDFRAWRGGPGDESVANMIYQWTYTGPHIPRPEIPRVHINLWQYDGSPATNQEVVLDAFTFYPAAPQSGIDEPYGGQVKPEQAFARLSPASPNPFNPTTSIAYSLDRESDVRIAVYDVAGRRVTTLVSGTVAAGEHRVSWDGRDARGNNVASGVYLYVLEAGDVVEARRMVLVK